MRLQDDIDFTTLNWVKQELDETLKQARQALEAYVDDPADSSLMRFCATYLHQVQGTLRMVELYGASMVVEEMERLAQALLDGEVRQKDEAYSVLMRGIVQLPDYLERLQSGHKDIPIVLLPLLNDLRASRGEELFSESALFSPDLSLPLPPSANGAVQPLADADLKLALGKLRTVYQVCLLKFLRAPDPRTETTKLGEALNRVHGMTHAIDARRVWWIGDAVLEGIANGAIDASPAVKMLFGKTDREIKRLVDAGERAYEQAPPRELLKNLLYYVAHANGDGPKLAQVRAAFKLQSLMPSEKELEHAKGSISGHNRALLDTVSLAIKDDLLRVKEALDIFLRAQGNDPAELMAQVDVLDRVGDTLGMLGLGVPRRVVLEQRGIVEEIANKTRPPDESTLLDVAGALLYVEASLDDHIERLGADTPEDTGGPASGMELPKAEVRKILDALMKEASANLSQAKNDIVAFIESPWDHAKVEQIPRLLEEVSGALRMLDLNRPAELMHGLIRFIEVELLRWRRVPTAEQMDKLADTIASIEYYLEATRDQRGGREKILDVTRESLEALGYWPVPDDDGLAPEPPPGTRLDLSSPTPVTTASAAGFADQPQAHAGPIAAPEARAADLSIGQFVSFAETLPDSRAATLKDDADYPFGDLSLGDLDHPALSVDVMPDHNLDEFVARLGLPDVESAASTLNAPAGAEAPRELKVAVEIVPGEGLDALVVGDQPAHVHTTHDLTGLRLTETESTPIQPVSAEPRVRYVEVEEEIEEEVEDAAQPAVASDASFQAVASDDIDEEIREVFLDEVQDEITNLNNYMPAWKADVHDFERLKPVRRSFHTLKGSGRLVGAIALGEFSWKVENMLNRVLDKSISANAPVTTIVDQAVAALPELLAALRGEGAPAADIAGIMNVADRLAAGEEAWLAPAQPRVRKVKRVVKRLVAVPVEDEIESVALETPAVPELTRAVDIGHEFTTQDAAFADVDAAELPSAGPLPNIDPVLFDILKSEVSQHLAVVDAFVDDSRYLAQPATDTLLRAVHTLHGAIAMVDIPVIGQVLAPLEGYVKRLRARDEVPGAVGLAALTDASSLVGSVMIALENGAAAMPDSDALVERIIALRDDLPEPELAHTLYTADDEASAAIDSISIDSFPIGPDAIDSVSIEASEAAPAVEALAEPIDFGTPSELERAAAELTFDAEPVALADERLDDELSLEPAAVPDASADEELTLELDDEFAREPTLSLAAEPADAASVPVGEEL
ncbi:MAG TPA: Hpt domain-containing protein, partial [Tahibacter sp.]|nr:Hpt domain-containing protein [Tahibacter sp.]